MNFVHDLIVSHNLVILAITETWLLSSMPDSFVHIDQFTIVRKDVEGTVCKHGVCIYIRKDIIYEICDVNISNVCAVHFKEYNMYLIALYRPPSNSHLENAMLTDFLSEFCVGKEIIVVGDLNLPSVFWSSEGPSVHATPQDRLFLNCFALLGLTQWVHQSTFLSSGNTLDLVLTSETDRIGNVEVLAPLTVSTLSCNI